MGISIVEASHLDHGLSQDMVDYLVGLFEDRDGFFIETVELPEELGAVTCGLYGPLMGDDPITDDVVMVQKRGERDWTSRVVSSDTHPVRKTRLVTLIAGPHGDESCVLYTAFGGPLAPQEPGDPGCKDKDASEAFWSEHALSV